MSKADTAFRTISEVAADTGVAQHILRYWETRFPQLRPLQRAGNRRYYRPDDVVLVRRIDSLLNGQGYTIKGVQKLLADDPTGRAVAIDLPSVEPSPPPSEAERTIPAGLLDRIRAVRDGLARALADDAG